MSRLHLGNPRVKEIAKKLAKMVAVEGSINALRERLNHLLAANEFSEKLHPNRLHILLSEDPARGVNDATLSLVARAIDLYEKANPGPAKASDTFSHTAKDVMSRWSDFQRLGKSYAELAADLGLQPALVRHILEQNGLSAEVGPGPRSPSRGELRTPAAGARRQPDWSYQDDAVARCVDALRANPAAKVGAILPTGAGKTRIALRIAFQTLRASASDTGRVLWVTHRRTLRRQAHQEMRKMLMAIHSGLPDEGEQLARRIEFVMLKELPPALSARNKILLVIVDEGHHAAAASYQPLFETPYPLRALFLTATPNRTDGLPIGIDNVAYTVTYRELVERGTVIRPDFLDFPVTDFDWSSDAVRELANEVIENARSKFVKTLVLAPRVDRVREFYDAILNELASQSDHVLDPEDVGYVHANGNSLGFTTDDFLSAFAGKPRAIMVSTQLLLEGFDDPSINSVVLTYPSSSMIVLMQAAGRCVRYTPTKETAYVMQARNNAIQYHFDQRWMYQELSDFLRPDIEDRSYSDRVQLEADIAAIIRQHHVAEPTRKKFLAMVENLALGQTVRLLIYGLPYYGEKAKFETNARWGAILETNTNSAQLRDIFNTFCAIGANASDPTEFLHNHRGRFGLPGDPGQDEYRQYTNMLLAMYHAKREVIDNVYDTAQSTGRPYQPHKTTTWLKYITFVYRPLLPVALDAFLDGCYNRDAMAAEYLLDPRRYCLAVKLPVPMGGNEAYLLDPGRAEEFGRTVDDARAALSCVPTEERFVALAAYLARTNQSPLPRRVMDRLERFLSVQEWDALTLSLATP